MESSFVQAKYEYEYISGSGAATKMFPGDLFTLVRKSNSDWWYVYREGEQKPVYLPATYLEALPDNVLQGLGAKASTQKLTGVLIPHTNYVEPSKEPHQPSNPSAAQVRHNNLVSEMSNMLRHRVTIPAPDYETAQETTQQTTQHLRPTQLTVHVQESNGRQVTEVTPIGDTFSPMTDSEPSSHSEPSSVNSPDYCPPPSHELQLPSQYSNPNLTSTSQLAPSSHLVVNRADEWETHTDKRGRKYYYKPSTNETTWDPPKRSPSVSPKISKKTAGNNSSMQQLPPGWKEEESANGNGVFVNSQFKEKWYQSQNDQGRTYYYSGDREETGWHLPTNVHRRHSETEQSDIHPETASSEREGNLQYVQIREATRKIKWQNAHTVMNGSALTFFKDIKLKSGTADMMIELWGSEVSFHNEKQSKYTKKSYIELHTATDKEYWFQGDTEEDTHLWYTAIHGAVRSMPPAAQRPLRRQNSLDETYSQLTDGPINQPTSPRQPKLENLIEIGRSRTDKKKIKNKLKSFISKRPTIESLQKQGIMKEENVFGRHIQALCQQQGTHVPRFVTDCISLIDKSGLLIDGIYRVSGNLSLIQRLRFLVDQEKTVDFNSSPWKEDIHVIAGALKLYFRELPEPLVTFDGYDKYMTAMKNPDKKSKLRTFQEVTSSLPRVNQETMKVLYRHLNRVVDHKDRNRMLAQNLAIVFGPTLMWQRKESFNVAMTMIFQNQCIEFMINEHLQIFK